MPRAATTATAFSTLNGCNNFQILQQLCSNFFSYCRTQSNENEQHMTCSAITAITFTLLYSLEKNRNIKHGFSLA
jgi:hypothetical protein